MTDIEALIDRANFDENDRDIGTSGLCAMFALALYRAVIDQHPVLVLIGGTRDGKPMKSRDGGLYWVHAALKVGGDYYDIDGKQQVSWMFSNYAWSLPLKTEPAIIELAPQDFVREVRGTKNARDWRYYTRWKQMLGL